MSLVLTVGLMGCATAKPLELVEPGKAELPNTAVAISYEFKLEHDVMQGEACTLSLRNLDHGGGYSIPLEVGKGARQVIAQVIPGRYLPKSIYCHSQLEFIFEGENSSKTVIAARTGKINHGGSIKLIQAQYLGPVEYRWENLTHLGLGAWKDEFVPSRDRARVVSALERL